MDEKGRVTEGIEGSEFGVDVGVCGLMGVVKGGGGWLFLEAEDFSRLEVIKVERRRVGKDHCLELRCKFFVYNLCWREEGELERGVRELVERVGCSGFRFIRRVI